MIKLRPERVLVYYDQPQLFIATDQVGGKYVCLYTDTSQEHSEYISVPVSIEKLNALILGKIDLREALLTSETGFWYKLISKDDNEEDFQTEQLNSVDYDLLPEQGFFFPSLNEDDATLYREVLEKGNTILHLKLVDNYNSHSMAVDILADFMKLFQGLVKNAYKKAIAQTSLKKELDRPENYTLKAFAVSPGSFNLHMESKASTDLFGNSQIDISLLRINEIISEIGTEGELLDKLKPYKGHTITTYKKLLEKIINNNISLSYQWASPSLKEVNKKTITKQYAERAYEIITSKTDLGQEIRELVGYVKQVDVEKGNWRILNTADNKEYSGQAKEIKLDGITVETIEYIFRCEEVLEELKISEQEKAKYILLEFREVVKP